MILVPLPSSAPVVSLLCPVPMQWKFPVSALITPNVLFVCNDPVCKRTRYDVNIIAPRYERKVEDVERNSVFSLKEQKSCSRPDCSRR